MKLEYLRRTCLLLPVLGLACSDAVGPETQEPTPPVASLSLRPDGFTVGIERQMQLFATAVTAEGDTIPEPDLTWTSSDSSVVTVSADGKAQGVDHGSARITVSADGQSASVDVLSGTPVNSVRIDGFSLRLLPGDTTRLRARMYPPGAGVKPPSEGIRQLVWESTDSAVATVDSAGLVTAVAPGTAVLNVTVEGKGAEIGAAVLGTLADFQLSRSQVKLTTEQTTSLTITPVDAFGTYVDVDDVRWESSDSTIAVLEKLERQYRNWSATIVPAGAGSAEISVMAGDVARSLSVGIRATVEFIELRPLATTGTPGDEIDFEVTLRSADGMELPRDSVVWTSSNLGVARVDGDGMAELLTPGTTTISATKDGRVGTANVTVTGSPPTAGSWARVSAGGEHTCAVDTSGQTFCWGRNNFAQLGTSSGDSTGIPTPVAVGVELVTLDAAGVTTCGLDASGTVRCWGHWNATPINPTPSRRYTTLHAGGETTYGQSCGVQVDRSVYCWVIGYTASPRDYFDLPGPFLDVVASHPCAVRTDGVVECWSVRSADPVPYPLGGAAEPFVEVVGEGYYAICARGQSGAAHCTTEKWVGVGGAGSPEGLRPVAGEVAFAQIDSGEDRGCGLDADGKPYCWTMTLTGGGATYNIALGAAQPIAGDLRFLQISVGKRHACGVTASGAAYCWGDNQFGQLGIGFIGGSSADPARVLDGN